MTILKTGELLDLEYFLLFRNLDTNKAISTAEDLVEAGYLKKRNILQS